MLAREVVGSVMWGLNHSSLMKNLSKVIPHVHLSCDLSQTLNLSREGWQAGPPPTHGPSSNNFELWFEKTILQSEKHFFNHSEKTIIRI